MPVQLSQPPIRIHPDNPKIFEFRGKPLVLVTATEHYGAVMNRPFRFERYLEDASEKRMTLTRLFALFREQQSPINPYSTCKPESPDFVAPFARTGPGVGLDGQPKYDLDRWNPEYFERLHNFMKLASDYGIVVELVLLSNTYVDSVWTLNPLHAKNNVNDLDEVKWSDYISVRHPKILERQLAHVRKIVQETNHYDNLFYEICNEPGGGFQRDASRPSPADVDVWQMTIADTIRKTEADLPNKHLIAGQEAFTYDPWEQSSTKSFNDFAIDIVNMHPLPNTTYAGARYDMGEFMSKQLELRAVKEYCLATYDCSKPLNVDEDNVASQYKDFDGWTIHRKRAWTTLLCGCHYDYIDFSIINYCETGTDQSQKCIRAWMKNLSEYIHSLDLVRAKPLTELVKNHPEHILESVLGIDGEDYSIYLADDRELGDEGYGEPISGKVELNMPPGSYLASLYSPVSGMYSPVVEMSGGESAMVNYPSFMHDLAIRIRRRVETAA